MIVFISLTKTKVKYCVKKVIYRLYAKKIDKILKTLFYYKFIAIEITQMILYFKIFYLNQGEVQR